ncbi:MAG: HAD family phosphatase [Micrococcaceae bacterium]
MNPKKYKKLPDAFLLDMDGTLIDSEHYWIEMESELAKKWGVQWTTEQGKDLIGNSMEYSFHIFRSLGINMSDEEFLDYFMEGMVAKVKDHVPFRPGALHLFQLAEEYNIPCCLVTMSHRPLADAFLEQIPKGIFAASVTGDMVENGKPDPEPYLYAVKLLKEQGHDVSIHDSIAIEDSIPGVNSALASGAATIGIPLIQSLKQFQDITLWDTLEGKTIEDFEKVLANAQ